MVIAQEMLTINGVISSLVATYLAARCSEKKILQVHTKAELLTAGQY